MNIIKCLLYFYCILNKQLSKLELIINYVFFPSCNQYAISMIMAFAGVFDGATLYKKAVI